VKLKWIAFDHEAGLYGLLLLKIIYRGGSAATVEASRTSTYVVPSREIRLGTVVVNQGSDHPEGSLVVPDSWRPYPAVKRQL
jgi:hypothetical protein